MKFRRSLVPFARCVTFLSSGVVALSITIAPTASAAALLDQGASFKGTGEWVGVTSSQSMAQVVTPGISGTLTKVALGIANSGTATNLTIGIYPAASGVPTGSALASTTITDFSGMSTGQAMFDIDFATPTAVTAGTTYAIVATTTDPIGPGAGFKWYVTSAYIGGDAASNVGVVGIRSLPIPRLPLPRTYLLRVQAVHPFQQPAPLMSLSSSVDRSQTPAMTPHLSH